jgi:hypothetical protein
MRLGGGSGTILLARSRFGAASIISSGRAAEVPGRSMQKLLDKWFLPVVFVMIGGAIVWALWRG